jgi:uncharacterized protein YlxW (UPF0749 family)
MDNNEMKVIALREGFKVKIAEIYDTYEDKVADLRVQLTISSQKCETLQQEVDNLTAELNQLKEDHLNAALEAKEGPDA